MSTNLDESKSIQTEKKIPEPKPEEENPLLPLVIGQFMKIARRFEEQGDIHQAIGVYTKVIDEYPDSKEAGESRLALYNLAEKHLRDSDTYSAMALFEKVV